MSNPYSDQGFFGFFCVLVRRLLLFFCGEDGGPIASDEIQCVVLLCLGLSLAFLGSFLVLQQMTMLANALSHTLLVGIILAALILRTLGAEGVFVPVLSVKVLWIAACITGFLTTWLTERLTQKWHLPEDGSIAFVFTTLFALGILLVTLFTRNMHLGVEAVMGNIDALHVNDIKLSFLFSLVVVLVFLLLFRGFFAMSFDRTFAKTLGFPVRGLNHLLMVLTAGGAIVSFRAVGVLLFLAFLAGPVLMARMWTHSLKKLIFYSFCISSFCSLIAIALSRHIFTTFKTPVSTAGLVVTVIFCFYISLLMLFYKKQLWKRFFRNIRRIDL